MSDNQDKQIEIAARLQLKWLERMEAMIDEGTATATDMATLARVLQHNGWSIDPAKLPQGLRDKLTSHLDPEDFEDDDVLQFPTRTGTR